jgi:hypothetical protein
MPTLAERFADVAHQARRQASRAKAKVHHATAPRGSARTPTAAAPGATVAVAPYEVPEQPTPDRLQLFARLLSVLPPGRLVDLGAGHGHFSVVAKELGWKATAVDARTVRFPDIDGIEWVHSDVRDFPVDPGSYDLVAILGLLYHLDLASQVELMSKVAHTPTIVDTHVATEADLVASPHRASLGPWVDTGGYRGRYYSEVKGGTDQERAATATASWGNAESFWPDEPGQLRMFREAGFASVLRMSPPYLYGRTFYLCLPEVAPHA